MFICSHTTMRLVMARCLLGFCCSWICFATKSDQPIAISQATFRVLEEAQVLLEAARYEHAIEKLNGRLDELAGSAGESALLYSARAAAQMGLEAYADAVSSLESAIATQALSAVRMRQAQYDLTRLHMALGQFDVVVELLPAWIAGHPDPPVRAYVLLGQAYVQLKRWPEAQRVLSRAIQLSSEPEEQWYQLLLAVLDEVNEYEEAKRLLQQMIALWPGRVSYWQQLAGLHQMADQHRQALAVLELAYAQNLLDEENDLHHLALLYMQEGQGDQAARTLTAAMAAGALPGSVRDHRLLGEAHYLARNRESAMTALQAAALKSNALKDWERLATVATAAQKWPVVIEAASSALNAPDVDQPGRLHLLLGIAHAESGNSSAARPQLLQASRFGSTREQAEAWLAFIDQDERTVAESEAELSPGRDE